MQLVQEYILEESHRPLLQVTGSDYVVPPNLNLKKMWNVFLPFRLELLLFSNSSEFFCLPHSFSSGSRVPRIPLRSLRIPLGVLVLHCGVRLRIPPVRRVIPEFR